MKNAFKPTVPTRTLGELCDIKAGVPVARAKKTAGDQPRESRESHESRGLRTVDVLLPKAMDGGRINRAEVTREEVGDVKDDCFTREGDVVLKLSTPYDAAYVEVDCAGILVTSFAMVLRRASDDIDMRYLAMFLNTSMVSTILASKSTGVSVVKLLKRADVETIEVPLLPLGEQRRLAELDGLVRERTARYQELIALDRELAQTELLQAVLG